MGHPSTPAMAGLVSVVTVRSPSHLWSLASTGGCRVSHYLLWAVPGGVRAGRLWGLHAGWLCRRKLCSLSSGPRLPCILEVTIRMCSIYWCHWVAAVCLGLGHSRVRCACAFLGSAGPLALSPVIQSNCVA